MAHSSPLVQALVLGFKVKALHFYGRSSRSEFWYFYLTSWLLLGISFGLGWVPTVGSLLQAMLILVIVVCQITATIRRLHDTNLPGFFAAVPYVLPLIYALARQPVHALYPESVWVLTVLEGLCLLSWVGLWILCARKGSQGANRYGTDPLDLSQPSQDFINPQHFADPEYLGDPWRKFKAKVAREKQAAAEQGPTTLAKATPQAGTNESSSASAASTGAQGCATAVSADQQTASASAAQQTAAAAQQTAPAPQAVTSSADGSADCSDSAESPSSSSKP